MSTIFDVARQAGVSITTVSRALNGHSDVSEATRSRIVEAASSLHYYPSAIARNLQGRRTGTIAFAPLISQHVESEPFFTEFLGLLALSAFHHNISLLATVAYNLPHSGDIYRELAGSNRVDGVILADIEPHDERIALLRALDLLFVAFGRTADYESLAYPFVDVDNESGMRRVMEYLLSNGHNRIAYIGGPLNTSYSLHRYSGYRKGLEHSGLPVEERLVIADLQVRRDTARAVEQLLSPGPTDPGPITAIVAANDNLALQVVRALMERGIDVGSSPGNIAVTGFDDLPFAEHVDPPLTTVRQPLAAIADLLLDMLAQVIERKTPAGKKQARTAKSTHSDGQSRTPTPGKHAHANEAAKQFPVQEDGEQKETIPYLRLRESPQVKRVGPQQALVVPALVVRASA